MVEKKEGTLKEIIKRLHAGGDLTEVKRDFRRLVGGVSPDEIAAMEQALIDEGFPPEEIQRLCDVHVDIFAESLKKERKGSKLPGHPVHTFMLENTAAKKKMKRIGRILKTARKDRSGDTRDSIGTAFDDFRRIELHYSRKENQLFPFLEKKKFTGPSRVMWGKHDEIRTVMKKVDDILSGTDWSGLEKETRVLFGMIKKMIFMEERILFPAAMRKLDERDWALIRNGESEIGYAWVRPGNVWDAGIVLSRPAAAQSPNTGGETAAGSRIDLEVGSLSAEQINLMLKNLPVDVTFVDENDTVRYYTGSAERVFPRSPAVIGRAVQNCHPQKSVHVVNAILDAFKKGDKKAAEFWIGLKGSFVHIRYFPLFDFSGTYRGCIEVTQDVSTIRTLEGEKRLLD